MIVDSRVKHRKLVSSTQLAVLELLYKYRFGSSELLRSSLGLKSNASMFRKLVILKDKGYVEKRFASSYRIKGVPASYCLLPEGIRELQKLPKYQPINDKQIKFIYNNRNISEPFIAHNLDIYRSALHLQRLYPAIKLFTKPETSGLSYMPTVPPDLFVSLKQEDQAEPHRFFLDIIPSSTPRRVLEKRIADLLEFFEDGSWEETAGSVLPTLLILCESGSFEKRVQRMVARRLYDEELSCLTSTLLAIRNANPGENIWSNVDEPDDLVSLAEQF